MAGDAVVGALRVVLGMDTASFEDGAKKAAKSASSFGEQLLAVFGGVTLASAVEGLFNKLSHAFKEGITQSLEFADQMGKMAQKVGLPVEQLTQLGLAAKLSDVSMENLSKSLGILSKNMFDASKGTGDAKKIFDGLGISVTDGAGKLRSVGDVLADLAGKFSESKDGASKVAIALALMGRGGKELIPLLNEGKNSLKDFADTAKNMGLVISEDTAQRAQKFNDDLKILGLTQQGIANLVTAELLPALVNLSGQFVDSAKKGDFIRAAADFIVDSIKTLVKYFLVAVKANETLGQAFQFFQEAVIQTLNGIASPFIEIGKLAIAVGQSFLDGFIKPIGEAFTKLFEFLQPVFSKIAGFFGTFFSGFSNLLPEFASGTSQVTDSMKKLNDALGEKQFAAAGVAWEKMKGQIGLVGASIPEITAMVDQLFTKVETGAHKAAGSLDEVKPSKLTEELNKLYLQASILGGKFNDLPTGFAQLAVSLDLTDKAGKTLGTTLDQLSNQQLMLATGLANVAVMQAAVDLKTPWQTYSDTLQQIAIQHALVGDSADLMARRQQKAALAFAQSMGQQAKDMVSGWADAFKTLAEQNKQFAIGAKALAIAEAIINSYLAATKALASGVPPFSYIAAAGALAAGLANVAKISATQFAQGGSFKVGGSGGIDSQLISFKATPGEMVDVRTPGQQAAATTTEIVLRGTRPSDIFTRDTIAALIGNLNDAHRDGYRLRFAE